MQNVLVTGGAGFIGANFIRLLLTTEPAVNVVNLDKLTYAGSLQNLCQLPDEKRYHFIKGDIADRPMIAEILGKFYIDTIVHFAAESHVDRSITGPDDFINSNIIGTFNLIEAARAFAIKRFHHISTDEVFGSLNIGDPAFTEKTSYAPRSPYSASKAGSDHLVMAYHHTYGLPVTISHCSNNYGPYQHAEKFIPTIIRSCLNEQPIPVYGNGKNIRDWLFVEDHCHAIISILKHGKAGDSYNIGGNNELENIELARYICAIFDELRPQAAPYARLLQYVNDRAGHDFRYAIDSAKIQNRLGWKPVTDLATGMKKTVEFYRHFTNVPA